MINIAEILKDCPKGTKLYSPICGECRLIKIYDGLGFDVINDTDDVFNFSYDGRYNLNGECCIFPSKENRDWNTFRPFKDGDIISNASYIAIFHKFGKPKVCGYDKVVYYHCWCYQNGKGFKFEKDYGIGRDAEYRFATDEEKQKLFDVIKENGYKWNSETKTLEKIIVPKFKAGDKIKEKNERFPSTRTIGNYTEGIGYFTTINDWVRIEDQDNWELVPTHKFKVGDKIVEKDNPFKCWYVQGIDTYSNSDFYYIVTKGQVSNLHFKDQDNWELVPTPKFKVGDIVKSNWNKSFDYKIIKITDTHYTLESIPGANTYDILICEDENWKLVPNKFDISNLKAYDKVLVRDTNEQVWVADLFSHALDRPLGGYTFACVGHYPNQCIPYEGNGHLLGKCDDCDEYYKNW